MSVNPERGEVAFAGLTLKLTAHGYCVAEEELSINIPAESVQCEMAGAMSFRLITAILYGALVEKNPGATPVTAKALIDKHGFTRCAIAAKQVYHQSLPVLSEGGEEPGELMSQKKAPDSTG